MGRYKKDLKRLQMGIGRPESHDPEVVADYVLGKFNRKEKDLIEEGFKKGESLLTQEGFLG